MTAMVLDEVIRELRACSNPQACERFEEARDFAADVMEALGAASRRQDTSEEASQSPADALGTQEKRREESKGTGTEA